LQRPFQGHRGLGPSLYVAGDYLTGHDKAYFYCPTHTKLADAMRSFQFGVRCFDACTDLVPIPPCSCLLQGIHVIPQADLGSDLQTEIPDGVTGLAAFSTMVGGPCRTAIEHRARPTQVTVEDRMERATRCVVGAQYAMVYRAMAHRASSRKTF
jgi:hypothetical protein